MPLSNKLTYELDGIPRAVEMETVELSTHLNSLACAYKEIPPYLALLSGIAILLLILVSRKSFRNNPEEFFRHAFREHPFVSLAMVSLPGLPTTLVTWLHVTCL